MSNFVYLSIGRDIDSGIVTENKVMNGDFYASRKLRHIVIFILK